MITAVRTMLKNRRPQRACASVIFSLFNKLALMYFLSAVLVAACRGSVLKVLAVSTPIGYFGGPVRATCLFDKQFENLGRTVRAEHAFLA